MSQTRDVTVLVADRPYPLRIQGGDEATIRRLVKEINDKISLFQANYPKKDRQDCLALALLTYAVDLHKAQNQANAAADNTPAFDLQPIADRIEAIEKLLDL